MRITTFIFILFCLISCNNKVPKDKLTIIDNLILGETKEEYQAQLKQLDIPNKNFYTQWLLFKPDDTVINKINFYYTKQFNFSEFIDKANSIEHLGVFVPEFINNKNLSSLTILLGHTDEALATFDSIKVKGKYTQFRQDVSKEIINKIKDLYSIKYGKPEIQVDTTTYKEYYLLFENAIQKNSIQSVEHCTYIWETEYFRLTFFAGTNLNAYYIPGKGYSQSTNRLFTNLKSESLSGNQQPCYSVPYIKYELNSKALQKLNFKNLNL
jgi:hypothetical protein